MMATDFSGKSYSISSGDGNNTTKNLTAGPDGGLLYINIDQSLNASTKSVQTINIKSNNNTNLDIKLTSGFLNGLTQGLSGGAVHESFDGKTAKITISFLGTNIGTVGYVPIIGIPIPGIVNIKSTPIVINITGNPFGWKSGYKNTISLNGFLGGLIGSNLDICFLGGSLISTPSGDINVEEIKTGDEVLTYVEGAEFSHRVTWAGRSTCNVRNHLPDDEAGYPVRILKNAIAENVPFKDLLVTAEHSLFFDGKFVPARMLVNGRSIVYDKSFTSYDYYHIETEDHSVIKANGALTESYLDTGNRYSFRHESKVVSIRASRALSWEDDSAYPLGLTREFVEPIFQQIRLRAETEGFETQTLPPTLTADSDLHLTTENGTVIRPLREANARVIFMVPPGVNNVRIVSNTSRPCDVIGPFVDDRRTLGVLVGNAQIFETYASRILTAHLTDEILTGWQGVEEGTMRWTTGDACLDLGTREPETIALLALQILASGPYLVNETTAEKTILRA